MTSAESILRVPHGLPAAAPIAEGTFAPKRDTRDVSMTLLSTGPATSIFEREDRYVRRNGVARKSGAPTRTAEAAIDRVLAGAEHAWSTRSR